MFLASYCLPLLYFELPISFTAEFQLKTENRLSIGNRRKTGLPGYDYFSDTKLLSNEPYRGESYFFSYFLCYNF